MALVSEVSGINYNQTANVTEKQFLDIVQAVYKKISLLSKWTLRKEFEASKEQSTSNVRNMPADDSEDDEMQIPQPLTLHLQEEWNQDGVMNYHCGNSYYI